MDSPQFVLSVMKAKNWAGLNQEWVTILDVAKKKGQWASQI